MTYRKIMLINTFIGIISSITLMGQDEINERAKSIVEEGKYLYKCEMASRSGLNVLMHQMKNMSRYGGYFSCVYKDKARCIIYSNDDQPVVMGVITFDSTYNVNTSQIDFTERKFSDEESELYTLRIKALELLSNDTLFKMYPEMSIETIPVMTTNEKKVYILTAPEKKGAIFFGGDYVMGFDTDKKLISKKRLHNDMIPIEYQERSDTTDEIISMHSHLNEEEELITPTDICILLLYEKFTNWNGINVISKKYLSFWNCEKDTLYVLTKKDVSGGKKQQKKKEN